MGATTPIAQLATPAQAGALRLTNVGDEAKQAGHRRKLSVVRAPSSAEAGPSLMRSVSATSPTVSRHGVAYSTGPQPRTPAEPRPESPVDLQHPRNTLLISRVASIGWIHPAMKYLYLVTRSLDPTGTGRARWMMRWKPVLNAFAITLGDCWPNAETY